MRYVVLLGILIFLSGCASTSAIYVSREKKYAPTSAVTVLHTPPQKPYVVIARLKTTGIPGMSYKTMLKDMVFTAKGLGANAVVVSGMTYKMSRKEIYYMPHRTLPVVRPPVRVPILHGIALRY